MPQANLSVHRTGVSLGGLWVRIIKMQKRAAKGFGSHNIFFKVIRPHFEKNKDRLSKAFLGSSCENWINTEIFISILNYNNNFWVRPESKKKDIAWTTRRGKSETIFVTPEERDKMGLKNKFGHSGKYYLPTSNVDFENYNYVVDCGLEMVCLS